MIYGKGINDTPRGWMIANDKNQRIYNTWQSMFCRCYSEKYHERKPTYKGCTVCKRWLLLSNFIEDIKLIDGYEEDKFLNGELELDKDIKSNGANKEYSLDNCMWVSKSENAKQSNKTMDYTSISVKIAQHDKQDNLIKIWNCSMDIQRELEIPHGNIINCCKFWEMNCNKKKWFETHKGHPYKTCGGYIWKYYKET